MIRDNYIVLLGVLLHRFVSPSTGTYDVKLSVGLPLHPTIAIKYIGNSRLAYAFRVRRPCGPGVLGNCPGRQGHGGHRRSFSQGWASLCALAIYADQMR